MNELAQQLLGVAKDYLGPAAQAFLAGEFRALGISANTVTPSDVERLAGSIRVKASRSMGEDRAIELAGRLAAVGQAVPRHVGGEHRLASDAAAKLFDKGRVVQAEQAYRELAEKHGDAESYKGLARAQVALGDEGAAVTTLREAAAGFARKGDRLSAVALLGEAVALAPSDLAAHRRFAAALANQGDLESAIDEYARFVDAALAQNDTRRAWLELAYGRETLGELPGLLALVDRVARATGGAAGPSQRRSAPRPEPLAVREEPRREVPRREPPRREAPPREAPSPIHLLKPLPKELPPEPVWPKPTPAMRRPTPEVATAAASAATHANTHALGDRIAAPAQNGKTRPAASHTAVVLRGAKTLTHAEQGDMPGSTDLLARAGLASPSGYTAVPRPPRPPLDLEAEVEGLVVEGSDQQAAHVAATRAALLVAMHDARATEATIDAARRLLALGLLQSASDVLLDYIAHGYADREAQRLLVDVDCALGRRDVAKEKCQLLSFAYRLDGQVEVADDVDRLARII